MVESGRYVAPIVTAEVLSERTILGFDHDEYEDAVDYVVSADLLSANGQQAVLPYLLGVLDLTGEQRAARRRALEAGAAFASVRV